MDFSQIDPGRVLVGITVLLFSLSIHESAHAWSADRLGDGTARNLGRVSLNPLVHIDPIGTLLFPLLGILSGMPIFGWAKPVPVQTFNLADPKRDHLIIAAAGPASNLVAAAFFLVGIWMFRALVSPAAVAEGAPLSFVWMLLVTGLLINVVLAVFNLIPVPPLDGSWILSGLLPDELGGLMDRIRPYGFLLLILFLYTGVFRMILTPVLGVVQALAF